MQDRNHVPDLIKLTSFVSGRFVTCIELADVQTVSTIYDYKNEIGRVKWGRAWMRVPADKQAT